MFFEWWVKAYASDRQYMVLARRNAKKFIVLVNTEKGNYLYERRRELTGSLAELYAAPVAIVSNWNAPGDYSALFK